MRKFDGIPVGLTILPAQLFYTVDLVSLILLLYVDIFVTVQYEAVPKHE